MQVRTMFVVAVLACLVHACGDSSDGTESSDVSGGDGGVGDGGVGDAGGADTISEDADASEPDEDTEDAPDTSAVAPPAETRTVRVSLGAFALTPEASRTALEAVQAGIAGGEVCIHEYVGALPCAALVGERATIEVPVDEPFHFRTSGDGLRTMLTASAPIGADEGADFLALAVFEGAYAGLHEQLGRDVDEAAGALFVLFADRNGEVGAALSSDTIGGHAGWYSADDFTFRDGFSDSEPTLTMAIVGASPGQHAYRVVVPGEVCGVGLHSAIPGAEDGEFIATIEPGVPTVNFVDCVAP